MRFVGTIYNLAEVKILKEFGVQLYLTIQDAVTNMAFQNSAVEVWNEINEYIQNSVGLQDNLDL